MFPTVQCESLTDCTLSNRQHTLVGDLIGNSFDLVATSSFEDWSDTGSFDKLTMEHQLVTTRASANWIVSNLSNI